jgi:hypothetical protein
MMDRYDLNSTRSAPQDQFEADGLLHRNVGRAGAAQDFQKNSCALTKHVAKARTVPGKRTRFCRVRPLENRRQTHNCDAIQDEPVCLRARNREQRRCQKVQCFRTRCLRSEASYFLTLSDWTACASRSEVRIAHPIQIARCEGSANFTNTRRETEAPLPYELLIAGQQLQFFGTINCRV